MTVFAFMDHRGVVRQSSTTSGICSQARTYFRDHGFRPAIHEIYWVPSVEEWWTKARNDLTTQAYATVAMRRAA